MTPTHRSLFPRADRHEALINTPWDERIAKAAIEEIVADAYGRFDSVTLWPTHPLDGTGKAGTTLYFGATGVIWALEYLARMGVIHRRIDFRDVVGPLVERNRAELRTMPYPEASSYLMGDVAILLLHWRLSPSVEVADRLFSRIEANTTQPVLELMWGTPGTMLAALCMYGWTHEPRWATLFRQQADRLWREWAEDPPSGYLWTQELYGTTRKWLGPVHGFAGHVLPLLRGRTLLDTPKVEQLYARVAETITKTAFEDDAYANWPPVVEPAQPDQVPILVQYCHGAPGIVTTLADFPASLDATMDRLLEKGGELTWKVGPLTKGPNLCHGTAGNGYAFLKLSRRTGKPHWLARARAFAMHAIAQWMHAREQYGQGRYSLWTGDLGLAVYLWDCLTAEARFPSVDVF